MAAEESSGTTQQLGLDHLSFEKLLAAAWVLQCVHDQEQAPIGRRSNSFEPIGKVNECAEVDSSALQSGFRFSAGVIEADSGNEALTGQPVNCGPFPNPAEIEQPAVNKEAGDIQDSVHRVRSSSGGLPRSVRITLTLRGLRAVAIATPVWLLSLIAALLFVEAWHYESAHNVQASRPTPPLLAAAVANISLAAVPPTPTKTALTTKKPAAIKKVEKTSKAPQFSERFSPLEVSHKQITDPAAFFAVQQLSRFEIETLRRQAKYGDDSVAFALGMAYEIGHFVPQNCKEAARWVKSAAEEGNAAAQYNLGLRYRDGDGVPVDLSLSHSWLRTAAAHRKRRTSLASKLFASR
jgi:Sel1 repeat